MTDRSDTAMIWGINPVREALSRPVPTVTGLWVQKGRHSPRLQEIIDQARQQNIRVRFTDLNRLVGWQHHQGIAARLASVPILDFDHFLDHLDASRLLALDTIQDPGNLGSMLRTALAAGFRDILLTRDRSAPITGTVVQRSAGAAHHLRIGHVTNMAVGLQRLKEKGFWIFGAVAPEEGASPLYDTRLQEPLVLVVGNEAKGIRPLVKKQCDQLVTIPMEGSFDSLNAAVAAAVIMFEVVRQQQ